MTFKKGANPLQFSWANTLIDPTSVELKFLTQADKLVVLDTTFPHAKPQMLYWNVQSEFDGEATIQITYFTSGITWTADYIAIADAAEKNVKLEGFVRVHNNSGEEYEDAQVRLVVGTINLVEKIAQLANIPVDEVTRLSVKEAESFERDAAKSMLLWSRAEQFGDADGKPRSQGRSSRKASASTSSSRSKAPRRFPMAGRSDCGRSKPRPRRSRSSIATGRMNTATSSCGCTC